jgi:uncharacterized membrane protein
MTAAAVAGGYLLIAVPNVELVSMTVAMAGLMFGPRAGATVGIFAMGIFGALNVFGIPYPPVWVAQMLGQAAIGLFFGLVRRSYVKQGSILRAWTGAVMAALLTFFYDLLTNLAFPIGTAVPVSGWWPYLVAGIPFAITHLVSNVLLFAFVLPAAWQRIGRRYATRLKMAEQMAPDSETP